MMVKNKPSQKREYNLFNKSIKEEFLMGYSSDTRKTYIRILDHTYEAEVAKNRDLYDFTKLEIEDVLFSLNPLTRSSSQSNGRIISAYINWTIEKKYRKNPINPLKTVDNSWFDKFVDKTKKLYFSYSELRNLENFCENAQDAVILSLLFDGVSGKECYELRSILKNSWNAVSKTLEVTDLNGSQRTVKLSDNSIKLLEEASEETTYIKKNGYMVDVTNGEKSNLLDTPYVLRSSQTKDDKDDNEVHLSVIYRRLTNLSSTLGAPYLTTKNILRSGVIYWGYLLLEKKRKDHGSDATLEKAEFDILAKKFNIKNPYSIKEYCNEEIINELYGK